MLTVFESAPETRDEGTSAERIYSCGQFQAIQFQFSSHRQIDRPAVLTGVRAVISISDSTLKKAFDSHGG